MSDRKEWELTDEERDAAWRGGHEYDAPVRVATAAARKALEWAEMRAKNCDGFNRVAYVIRKELNG